MGFIPSVLITHRLATTRHEKQVSERESVRRTKYEKKLKFSFSMHVYRHYSVLYVCIYIYISIHIYRYIQFTERIDCAQEEKFLLLSQVLSRHRSSMMMMKKKKKKKIYTKFEGNNTKCLCKFVTTSNWFSKHMNFYSLILIDFLQHNFHSRAEKFLFSISGASSEQQESR